MSFVFVVNRKITSDLLFKVGRTSERLEERIKQHVPRSIANPPASHNRQSLSRSCKANIRPQQFHKSAIGQHLLDNAQCALH